MKHLAAVLLAVLLLAAGLSAIAAPDIPPSPTTWVTDTAGFLSEPTRQALNTRLEAYERASGHQVLVWVGKTTGQTPMEDWTVRAFEAWRVGRKGLDDGLVLFLFSDDRRARIEVGYGLEEKIPDAVASRILRETILPRLQTGERDGAVTGGVDRLLAALGDTGRSPANGPAATPPLTWLQIAGLTLLALALLALAIRYPGMAFTLISMLTRGGGDGGGFGGRGGRSGGGGASGRW